MLTLLIGFGFFFSLLLAFSVFLFASFIFPVWTFIDCIQSAKLTPRNKIKWALVIGLFWFFGSCIYGLVASTRQIFRWLSALLLTTVLGLMLLALYMIPHSLRETPVEISHTIETLDHTTTPESSPEDRDKLKADLGALQLEADGAWSHFNQQLIAKDLNKLLVLMLKDGRLAGSDLKDWTAKFESRHVLDRRALEKYIQELKNRPATQSGGGSPAAKAAGNPEKLWANYSRQDETSKLLTRPV